MKALFRFPLRASPVLVIFSAFFCYSAEFQPSNGYANLREVDVDKVEVVFGIPSGSYTRIGLLIIRDYPGDIEDPTFLNFVEGEARRHGASGAWIAERTVKKGANIVQQRGRRGYQGAQTSLLEGDVAVVKVILYVRPKVRP